MKKLLLILLCALCAVPCARASSLLNDAVRIDPQAEYSRGHCTVFWTDDLHAPPYTLTYQYIGPKNAPQALCGEEGVADTQFTFDLLIPGSTYRITVENARGQRDEAEITLPEAPHFKDGRLKDTSIHSVIELRCRPSGGEIPQDVRKVETVRAEDVARYMGAEDYGFSYGLRFPTLSEPRVYDTLLALYTPEGTAGCYYLGTVTYANSSPLPLVQSWPFLGHEFFALMQEATGKIPAGEYIVDCYWDGMYVTRGTFTLK